LARPRLDATNVDELQAQRLDAFEKAVQGRLVQNSGQHRLGCLDMDIDVGEGLAGRWTDLTQYSHLILHLSHCTSSPLPSL
jgi:hypothetical protein